MKAYDIRNREIARHIGPDEVSIKEWTATEDEKKNIKWAVELGSRSYGGPVMAGGRIFIGTNNENPRDPKIKGDKGVVMCFQESDGKFLWQAVHDKLLTASLVRR